MTTIKALVFDIGNVVLYFDHRKMVQQLSNVLQVPFSIIKKQLFDEEMLFHFEVGAYSTDDLLTVLAKSSSLTPTKEELLTAFNTIFRENDALAPHLHSLKKRGFKLILLSNISDAHFNYAYLHFPILHLFDHAILSYQIKHAKPSKEIYKEVLNQAGCEAYECFYTDDILGHVQAAKSFGIDAEQFLSTELLISDLAKRMIFL